MILMMTIMMILKIYRINNMFILTLDVERYDIRILVCTYRQHCVTNTYICVLCIRG